MKKNEVGRQLTQSLDDVTRGDTDNAQGHSGQLAAGTGRFAVLSLAVEEVFLEGDSVMVLHHEAGSEQATDLLESADGLAAEGF